MNNRNASTTGEQGERVAPPERSAATGEKGERVAPSERSAATGEQGERVALRFLESKGLQLLEQNYRRPFGEIDLIMRERDCLVFVEVRVRRRSSFGDGFTSISARKQKKLWRAASAYLKSHPQLQKLDCRFDAVSITADEQGFHPEWIPGAFESGA